MKTKLIVAGAFLVVAFQLEATFADGPPQLLPPIVVVRGEQKGEKDAGKQPDKDKKPPEKTGGGSGEW